MEHGAFTSDEAVNGALAASSETIGGGVSFATGAVSGYDETRINHSANKGNTFVGGLSVHLMGMKGEVEPVQKAVDDGNITHYLRLLGDRDNDIKIIDVATVMLVAEVEGDEAVELVEEDVREELAGEITDDDAVSRLTMKEALVIGQS